MKRADARNPTNRDILTRQPDYWAVIPGCKLRKTVERKRGERLRHVLLIFNFPFAPEDFPHGGLRSRTASQNPVLWRLIIDPLEQAPDSVAAATAAELCGWVLKNIQLPPELRARLREAREKRQT